MLAALLLSVCRVWTKCCRVGICRSGRVGLYVGNFWSRETRSLKYCVVEPYDCSDCEIFDSTVPSALVILMSLLALICVMAASICLNSMLFFPYCACVNPRSRGRILNTLVGSVRNV